MSDIDYDKASMSLPRWKDDIWARIRKRTIELISLDSDELHKDFKSTKSRANDAINKANIEAFGKAKKKIKVITCLDSKHHAEDVIMHRNLFKKFMKYDFEYVCISNESIEGITTIKKTSCLPKNFQMLDAFRKDVSGDNCICLYASLDVVPVNTIEICNVPDGFIGLNNPRHSGKFEGAWILYLCNAMLFSGDFSFIYDRYAGNDSAFSQKKMFMNPDNCIAYNLYEESIDIRALSQFIDIRNVRMKRVDDYVEYAREVQKLVDNDELMFTQLASGNFI